jgi:DNA-binding transcriptional regulator YiaG
MGATARKTSGFGIAHSANRNRKVKIVVMGTWKEKRLNFFKRNVRLAASAKATRTSLEVTQEEIAKHYGVTQGTVCNWESGKYSWPNGAAELFEYYSVIRKIAGV